MNLSAGDFKLASEVIYLFDEGNVFLQGKFSVKRGKRMLSTSSGLISSSIKKRVYLRFRAKLMLQLIQCCWCFSASVHYRK